MALNWIRSKFMRHHDRARTGRVLQLDKLTCFDNGAATAPAYIFIIQCSSKILPAL